MSLKFFDPAYMLDEVMSAVEDRDKQLAHQASMVEKMTGPYWRGAGAEQAQWAPENTYYEYMSVMTPRLIFDNPRVRVTSRRQGPQQDVATSMRHGLNRLVRDIDLRAVLSDAAVDMLFNFGVVMVKEALKTGVQLSHDDPIYPATPTWPQVTRIPQRKFFLDSDAYRLNETRFRGHEWKVDRDDLLKRAKENPDERWNIQEIERIAADAGDAEQAQYGIGWSSVPHREEIRAYEVWVPEIELAESPGAKAGFHGTIFTLGIGQANTGGVLYDHNSQPIQKVTKVGFLRAPRPYYGRREGPYIVYGAYRVPDSPWPLSPLLAVEGQILELNDHVIAAGTSMKMHKKVVAVPDNRTAQLIKAAKHEYVIQVPYEMGKAQVQELEFGGHTEHQNDWILQSRERVERILGMDEAMRGNVTGAGTATEHTLASEAAATRIAFVKSQFTRATQEVLRACAFYMYHSDTVVFPMGEEMLEEEGVRVPEGQFMEPWFRGGEHDPESGYTFEDLELEIEPYSMERTNEGLNMQRTMKAFELRTSVLPLMAQFPDYEWKKEFQALGEALNLPNMEEFIPDSMIERLAKQMEQMAQAAVQPNTGQESQGPRYSKQVGMAGAAAGGGPATAARVQGQGMPGSFGGARAAGGRAA